MEKLKKILWWIISSSSNPKKVGTTVKGLSGLIPAVLILQKYFGADVLSVESLQGVVDGLSGAVVALLAAVSALYAAYGAVRKVYNRVRKLFV